MSSVRSSRRRSPASSVRPGALRAVGPSAKTERPVGPGALGVGHRRVPEDLLEDRPQVVALELLLDRGGDERAQRRLPPRLRLGPGAPRRLPRQRDGHLLVTAAPGTPPFRRTSHTYILPNRDRRAPGDGRPGRGAEREGRGRAGLLPRRGAYRHDPPS